VRSARYDVREARSAAVDRDRLGRTPVGWSWQRTSRLERRLAVRLVLVVAIALFLLAAPLVTQVDPNKQNVLARLQPPGAVLADGRVALLGTDQLGRDMYARILYGGQISLLIGVSGVLLAAGIGVSLGLVSGYYGRYADAVVMRLVDIQLGFPGLLLAITLAAALGPGVLNVVIALGVARWTTYARIVRSSVLTIKNEEYLHAARAIGASSGRILLHHVLPNTLSAITVIAASHLGQMIIAESALSFIGLGVQPPTPSWGSMINRGREYITTAWWLIVYPGLAMTLTVMALGMLGDAVRDLMDPHMRSRAD
jgi:peptide/nickel transport system permease protein